MNNIFSYLKPKNGDMIMYNSFLIKHSLEENINALWYHSAGTDFRSLYFGSRKKGLSKIAGGKPDLYIYTDMDKDIIVKIRDGKLFKSRDKMIAVNSYMELEFEDDIKEYFPSSFNKDNWGYRDDNYYIYLFDVNLGENEGDVPLLYFVWENTAFLKAFVIERNIKIKYFQKPREYGFGGGWFPSQVYLLFYLGLMETEYLFLENAHTYMGSLDRVKDVITKDKVLYEKFMCVENNFLMVRHIGTTLRSWNPQLNKNEYYNIIRLSKNTYDNPNMTFDNKVENVMTTLKIGY